MAALGIPDYRSVRLNDLRRAGGTSGARIALDSKGNRWVVKHYSGNRDRVASELLANAIYRELRVLVPEAGIGVWELPGRGEVTAAIYPFIEGDQKAWSEPSAALAEDFVIDALLGNRDVIGLNQDNIIWQGTVPIRLDQGACFEFRAMGERKEYLPEPTELASMLLPSGQANGTMAITREQILKRSSEVASQMGPDRVDELVSAAPFEDEKMRERIRENLKSRLGHLARIGGLQP
jgi:hypothetical protein